VLPTNPAVEENLAHLPPVFLCSLPCHNLPLCKHCDGTKGQS